jgi:hypothetical protein
MEADSNIVRPLNDWSKVWFLACYGFIMDTVLTHAHKCSFVELRARVANLETTANTRSKAQLAALEQKVSCTFSQPIGTVDHAYCTVQYITFIL